MVATTLNGVMLTGDHASRPTATTVAKGTLYSCSTHSLIYQSDASTWSTWATLGSTSSGTLTTVKDEGSNLSTAVVSLDFVGTGVTATGTTAVTVTIPGGSASVPGWIGAFVGTSDSTHYYWTGSDLAGFTTQTVTGSATWTEGVNLASVIVSNQTADDAAAVLIAQTFSVGHAWDLAVNTTMLSSDSGGVTSNNHSLGIVFADGTTTGANAVVGHVQFPNDGTTTGLVLVGRHGTLTSLTTAPWVSTVQAMSTGNWLWIRLIYQASNTFRLQWSPDRVTWSAFGEADISKTMTPTHVGLVAWNYNAGSAIASFGPLIKSA